MPKKIPIDDRIIISIPTYEGPGIYIIRNIVNNKVYIGSANNIHRRIKEHDYSFRKGYCNNKLQADIDLGHKFEASILENCSGMMLVEMRDREDYYVRFYNSYENGYNTAWVPVYDLNYYMKTKNQEVIQWLTRKL